MDPSNGKWSYRLIISDGTRVTSLVILQSNLKDLITFNEISNNSIIQIKHYTSIVFENNQKLR